MPDLDDGAIRRYLLGLLTEVEADAVEEHYFARPEELERIRGVEDDLLDDYAAGRLSPDELRAFESRHLASRPLRDRVHAARALRMAPRDGTVRAGSPSAIRPARWVAPAAIAAGLMLVALGLWPRPSAPPESRGPAGSESPDTRMLSRVPVAAKVVLELVPTPRPDDGGLYRRDPDHLGAPKPVPWPSDLRGDRTPKSLPWPGDEAIVVLSLHGNPLKVPPKGPRLRVVVQTVEGVKIWSGNGRHAAPEIPGLLATAELPAGRLPPGDYQVTLSSGNKTIHQYDFRVTRP